MTNTPEPCCKPCDCHCHRAPTYIPLPYPVVTPRWPDYPWMIWNDTKTTTINTMPNLTYAQVQPN